MRARPLRAGPTLIVIIMAPAACGRNAETDGEDAAGLLAERLAASTNPRDRQVGSAMRSAGVILTCASFLCGVAQAKAATVVVDFESIPPGPLSTATAQGVRFGEWYQSRAVGPRWRVIDETAGAQAASGTRLAVDNFRSGGGEFQCSRTPDEPKAPAIFGRLTSLASGLSVRVGTAQAGLPSGGEARLIGYDVDGDVVASASTETVTFGRAGTLLTATTSGNVATIAYFDVRFPDAVGATDCQDLLLDDLVITKPDTEEPGLALTYVGPEPDPNPLLKDRSSASGRA